MTIRKFCSFALLFSSIAFAETLDPRFFASRDFQNQFPGAFALQQESKEFVTRSLPLTIADANELIRVIRNSPALEDAILQFPSLTDEQRVQTMKTIFGLQTNLSGAHAPELVLDEQAKQAAFFDFDVVLGGAGRVILNPVELFKDSNPYMALLLLIHETRHSLQFQQGLNPAQNTASVIAQAYKAAFTAQRQVFDKSLRISFCDFLTLNNEYEAFLFGNYVMEELTAGAVDTSSMGTWASQFVPGHGLRINLVLLIRDLGAENLLENFNAREQIQYKEIYP